MDLISEYEKNSVSDEEFFRVHEAEIILFVKEHSKDENALLRMPSKMLEFASDGIKKLAVERKDIDSVKELVFIYLDTRKVVDRKNISEDIIFSMSHLSSLMDGIEINKIKDVEDAIVHLIEEYVPLIQDKDKEINTLISLLEHPYVDIFVNEYINSTICDYVCERLRKDSRRVFVERALDRQEEIEQSNKPELFSVCQTITTIASIIGDEAFTKQVIGRAEEIFKNDYLRSFITALLTLKDDKYALEFIYRNQSCTEEVVDNVPLVAKKKKDFDKFLDEYAESKPDRLLKITQIKSKRLKNAYSKEFGFRTLLDTMEDSEEYFAGLPESLRFGVEFEVAGLTPEDAKKVFGVDLPEWIIKEELSVSNGFEVTHPKPFKDGKGLGKIRRMADVLTGIGFTENEECGGHIHFDYGYFEDDGTSGKRSAINLAIIWKEAEEIFYKISNAPNDPTRRFITSTGDRIDLKPEDYRTMDLSQPSVQEYLLAVLKNNRNKGINFGNIGTEDKNTIEFRVSNGTIDKETLTQNIKLFGALMRVAKDMTMHPVKYEAILERYMDPHQSEREKIDVLMDLLFEDEKDKEVYIKRWDSVKDDKAFEQIRDKENLTFERGNYSLRDFARKQVHAVDSKDMTFFLSFMQRLKEFDAVHQQ